jgi:hypothetical protein
VDAPRLRPANVDEQLLYGFVPEGEQRTEVATTTCGIAITIWLEEPDPSGRWYRSVRYEDLGVSLLVRHADAIGGRRCKKCWPVDGAQ